MKKIFVAEDLNEFAKRGRPRKSRTPEMEDNWYSADDEFDSGEIAEPESIENVEIEDEAIDYAVLNRFKRMIDNELKLPEVDRAIADFTLKSTGEKIKGTPLAKLSGGEAILFKTPKGMKKVNIADIILESAGNRLQIKYVSESIKDYED